MHGRLEIDPDFAPPSDKAITGKRTRLDFNGLPPNLKPKSTQLISARNLAPRQWVVTLMQPVSGDSGISPWISTFDGGIVYPPVAPAIFTAPQMPASAFEPGLQVTIRWGAGGAAWQTKFDYPAVGGMFGITADALDLDVDFRDPAAIAVYATEGQIPVIGAFMVEGVNIEPTPLRWREDPVDLATNVPAFWAIKPYARRLRLATHVDTTLIVSWLDRTGNNLWQDIVRPAVGNGAVTALGVEAILPVVQNAVAIAVNSDAVAVAVINLEWQIGLT
jgi:hypothetical protein